MKKLILIALLLSLNLLYAQNTKTKGIVKEFKIETNNVEVLKDFEWIKVEKFFGQSNKNDSIKIVIILNNVSKKNSKTDVKMNGITSEVKGKVSELNELILKAKKMTKDIVETEKELKTINNNS